MIVDVQNDFISGSLAIVNCPARQDGEDVVAPINLLLDTVPFHQCYYRCKYFLEHPNIFASQMFVIFPPSLDWHPSDHVSFIDNVHMRRLAPGSKVSTVLYCTELY